MADSPGVVSTLLGWASFSKLIGTADDDLVDRLNHLYTVILLIIFAVFITTGQYAGNPIECWVPGYFNDHYAKYAKSYCWIKNTYYIPMSESIPVEHHKRDSEELTYYQWVPHILLFMAFLFKFPYLVWRILNGGSAINLDKIANMTVSTQLCSPDERKETINHIALYMDRWLEAHRNYRMNALIRMRQRLSKVLCFLCGKRDGTYLTGLYVAVKLLYLINVIVQFFILNAFMGSWFNLYGFEVIDGLVNDREWKESPRFPKVTLCDFDIRQLQNVQRYTVQCVLPLNLFNEKIFIFLWFWICLVAVLTAGNFLLWIYRSFIHHSRLAWIKKYLRSMDEVKGESDKKLARKFADEYLRDDGCFVLRLVAKNSSDILLADLILELWYMFKSKPASKAVLAEEDYLNHSSP